MPDLKAACPHAAHGKIPDPRSQMPVSRVLLETGLWELATPSEGRVPPRGGVQVPSRQLPVPCIPHARFAQDAKTPRQNTSAFPPLPVCVSHQSGIWKPGTLRRVRAPGLQPPILVDPRMMAQSGSSPSRSVPSAGGAPEDRPGRQPGFLTRDGPSPSGATDPACPSGSGSQSATGSNPVLHRELDPDSDPDPDTDAGDKGSRPGASSVLSPRGPPAFRDSGHERTEPDLRRQAGP